MLAIYILYIYEKNLSYLIFNFKKVVRHIGNFFQYFNFIVPKNFKFTTLILCSVILKGFSFIITNNYNISKNYIFYFIIIIIAIKIIKSKNKIYVVYSYIFNILVLFIFWFFLYIIYTSEFINIESFLSLFIVNYWYNMDFEINIIIDDIKNTLFNPNGPKPPQFDPFILGVNNEPDWDNEIVDKFGNNNFLERLYNIEDIEIQDTNLVINDKSYNITELKEKLEKHNSKFITLGMDNKYIPLVKKLFYRSGQGENLNNVIFNLKAYIILYKYDVAAIKNLVGTRYGILIEELNILYKAYLYYSDIDTNKNTFKEFKDSYDIWQKRQISMYNSSYILNKIYNDNGDSYIHRNFTDINVYNDELCENLLYVSLNLKYLHIVIEHLSENKDRINNTNIMDIHEEEIRPIVDKWISKSEIKLVLDKFSKVNIDRCSNYTVDEVISHSSYLSKEYIDIEEYKKDPLKWTDKKKMEMRNKVTINRLGLNTAYWFAYKPFDSRNFFTKS